MPVIALTALALATSTQSAHVHGHAEMAIAVESNGRMQIELTSPAYDFYGFEHAPRNDEQRASIEAADNSLRQGATLFNLIDGNCTFDAVAIDYDQDHAHDDEHDHDAHHEHGEHHDEHDHSGHDHGEHDHDEHHDHGEHHEGPDHDAHHEGHHEAAHEADSHGNVRVTYSGRCSAPGRISAIATTLFNAFPALEKVDGVFLSEQRQLAFELTPTQERARLPR